MWIQSNHTYRFKTRVCHETLNDRPLMPGGRLRGDENLKRYLQHILAYLISNDSSKTNCYELPAIFSKNRFKIPFQTIKLWRIF